MTRKAKAKPHDDGVNTMPSADEIDNVLKVISEGDGRNKHAMLKGLKMLESQLATVGQEDAQAREFINPLCQALAREELIRCPNTEVKLYLSGCIVQVLRIYAPDSPYDDNTLKEIFLLFSQALEGLSDPGNPLFNRCLLLLQSLQQIKCYMLAMDFDPEPPPTRPDDVLCVFVTALLSNINELNEQTVRPCLLSMLCCIMEEADLTASLLETLLKPLTRDHPGPAASVAIAVLIQLQGSLASFVQRYLTLLLAQCPSRGVMRLLTTLHEHIPNISWPLMPALADVLRRSGDEEARAFATGTASRLLELPGAGAALLREYPLLFDLLLDRFCDSAPAVRRTVTELAPGLIGTLTHVDPDRAKGIINACQERLLDPQESVRIAAINALIETGKTNASSILPAYKALIGRLRDKRPQVRRAAALGLLCLCRVWSEDSSSSSETRAATLEVAAAVLLAAATGPLNGGDAEISGIILDDTGLHLGLFVKHRGGAQEEEDRSGELSVESRRPMGNALSTTTTRTQEETAALAESRWWARLWASMDDRQRKAVGMFFAFQSLLREGLGQVAEIAEERQLLQLTTDDPSGKCNPLLAAATTSRNQTKMGSSLAEKELELGSRVQAVVSKVPDLARAEEALRALLQTRDRGVLKALKKLCSPTVDLSTAAAARMELLRLAAGVTGKKAEALRSLTLRVLPCLLSPKVLGKCLEHASEDDRFAELAQGIANYAPRFLQGQVPQLIRMVRSDDGAEAELGAALLARISWKTEATNTQFLPVLKELDDDQLNSIARALQDCALHGTATGVKQVVRATSWTLPEPHRSQALLAIGEGLLGLMSSSTPDGRRLQSLGRSMAALGRLAPACFARFAPRFCECILDDLLLRPLSGGNISSFQDTSTASDGWGHPSPEVAIKCQLIKNLTQAFSPSIETLSQLREELPAPYYSSMERVLHRMVGLTNNNPADPAFDTFNLAGDREEHQNLDAAAVRYAAVAGLFRTFRSHESRLSRRYYELLAEGYCDYFPEPRVLLQAKLRRALADATGRGQHLKASKLAALLAVTAGADPHEGNQLAAVSALQLHVLDSRKKESSKKPGEKAIPQQLPEYLLVFLVYIVALHPDFPSPADLGGDGEEEDIETPEQLLEPFVAMIQLALEPIITPRPGNSCTPESLSRTSAWCSKIFHVLRYCQVPDEEQSAPLLTFPEVPEDEEEIARVRASNDRIVLVCELGLLVLRRLMAQLTRTERPAPVQAFLTTQFSSLQPELVPGNMSLPRKFLQPLPNVQQGHRPAPRLPTGFCLELAHQGYLEQYLQQQSKLSRASKDTVKNSRSSNPGLSKDNRRPGTSHVTGSSLGTGIKSPPHRVSSPAEVGPTSTPSSHPPSKRARAIPPADQLASLRASSSDEEGGDTPSGAERAELQGKPTRQLAKVAELRAMTSDEESANESPGKESMNAGTVVKEEITMASPSTAIEPQGTKKRKNTASEPHKNDGTSSRKRNNHAMEQTTTARRVLRSRNFR